MYPSKNESRTSRESTPRLAPQHTQSVFFLSIVSFGLFCIHDFRHGTISGALPFKPCMLLLLYTFRNTRPAWWAWAAAAAAAAAAGLEATSPSR